MDNKNKDQWDIPAFLKPKDKNEVKKERISIKEFFGLLTAFIKELLETIIPGIVALVLLAYFLKMLVHWLIY
ncbi:MAG: hypothetical protein AAB377_00655 [Patescibacteria group bacterium]